MEIAAEDASGAVAALDERQLRRPFKVIAFDWDGTAVAGRHVDASPVRGVLGRLLELGVPVVVITGTNFQNIDSQLSSAMDGPHKRRLFLCTNRGSEVYGFDGQHRPEQLWTRVATREENGLLSEVAEGVKQYIETRTGLEIRIVFNRLNRRKIDLIPLPEWSDPPKSIIGELLDAVQERLISAGISGGLQEVIALTEKLAREKGLRAARITTDVKHVEVGLTDKGDSISWMMRCLAAEAGIRPEEVLIVGDEFGPIAGFEGSDHRMVVPAARGAVFVSVGIEPENVPPDVIHLGGGPARFLKLLEEQVLFHESERGRIGHSATTLTTDSTWFLDEEGFEAEREREIESLFTVSNGYVGTRGSLQEGGPMSLPATFLAGIFDRSGAVIERVVAPDWAQFKVVVEGEELRLDRGVIREHRRRLDLRRGLLERDWCHCDSAGRVTRLRFRRFVSLADRHVLVESLVLVPENYSGRVVVESIVDGRVANAEGVKLMEAVSIGPALPRLAPGLAEGIESQVLTARTVSEKTTLAFASASIFRAEQDVRAQHSRLAEEGVMGERWEWDAGMGLSHQIDKLVTAYTSRDVPDPAEAAGWHLLQLVPSGADGILASHVRSWEERWKAAEVTVEGDEFAQRSIRFAIYHLIAASNPDDEHTSIGARALTGESYRGHVFWDTEIYVLPFFVFTHPPAARALLKYRYHTLPAACDKAQNSGYQGALYAWESTDRGEEATPPFFVTPEGKLIPFLSGEQEHHISADVAYAVWGYWKATGDDRFFQDAGADILLQTARFWASRGKWEGDGRYHIPMVMGPDEYHEGVDDNAFTNVMAQWNLETGVETAQVLQKRWPKQWDRIRAKLAITANEIEGWEAIGRAMYTGFDPASNLFEQFKGYFELEYFDLGSYEHRTAPMDVLLGRERIAQTQIIKQADVLMLIFLLWDRFPPEVREANFRYYEPRCAHGSSLSPSIHALLAARLGDAPLAGGYFRRAAEIDLANNMGNAAGGVHAGAQGGLWQAVVLGFAGVRPREGVLGLTPHSLPHWRSLRLRLEWLGRKVCLAAAAQQQALDVSLEKGRPASALLLGSTEVQATISRGRPLRGRWLEGAWRPRKKGQ